MFASFLVSLCLYNCLFFCCPALSSDQNLLFQLLHFQCCFLWFSFLLLSYNNTLWSWKKKCFTWLTFQLFFGFLQKMAYLSYRDNKFADDINVGSVKGWSPVPFISSSVSKYQREKESKAKYLTPLLTWI